MSRKPEKLNNKKMNKWLIIQMAVNIKAEFVTYAGPHEGKNAVPYFEKQLWDILKIMVMVMVVEINNNAKFS